MIYTSCELSLSSNSIDYLIMQNHRHEYDTVIFIHRHENGMRIIKNGDLGMKDPLGLGLLNFGNGRGLLKFKKYKILLCVRSLILTLDNLCYRCDYE